MSFIPIKNYKDILLNTLLIKLLYELLYLQIAYQTILSRQPFFMVSRKLLRIWHFFSFPLIVNSEHHCTLVLTIVNRVL